MEYVSHWEDLSRHLSPETMVVTALELVTMNSRCESPGGDVTYIGSSTGPPLKAGVRLNIACAGTATPRNASMATTMINQRPTIPPRIAVERSDGLQAFVKDPAALRLVAPVMAAEYQMFGQRCAAVAMRRARSTRPQRRCG